MPYKNAKVFAKSILSNNQLPVRINPTLFKHCIGKYFESVIYRDGQYQIEIIFLFPGFNVPAHCHPHCDAAELWLGGDGESFIQDKLMPSCFTQDDIRKNLSRVPAGIEHHGAVGINGLMYLSFQKWLDIAPSYISDDWVDL